MQIDEKKLEETKKKAKEIYEKIGKVWCPCLKDEVFFNNEGFDHILFKTWNRGRSSLEQHTRLRLISLVPDIITRSHTLQEYDERKMLVRQNINSRWEKRAKLVHYYVFIAIIKEVRLKIIIKEIEGGNKIFYSLYPSWKTTKNSLRKKIFFSGNLEED